MWPTFTVWIIFIIQLYTVWAHEDTYIIYAYIRLISRSKLRLAYNEYEIMVGSTHQEISIWSQYRTDYAKSANKAKASVPEKSQSIICVKTWPYLTFPSCFFIAISQTNRMKSIVAEDLTFCRYHSYCYGEMEKRWVFIIV